MAGAWGGTTAPDLAGCRSRHDGRRADCGRVAVVARPSSADHGASARSLEASTRPRPSIWRTRSWRRTVCVLYYLDGGASGEAELGFQAPINGGEPAKIPLPFRFYRRIVAYLPPRIRPSHEWLRSAGPRRRRTPRMWIVSVPVRHGDADVPARALRRRLGERLAWIEWSEDRGGTPGRVTGARDPDAGIRPALPELVPRTAGGCALPGERAGRKRRHGSGRYPRWGEGRREPCGRARWDGGQGTGATSFSTATTRHSRGSDLWRGAGEGPPADLTTVARAPHVRVRSASMPSTRARMAVVSSRAD